MMKKEQEETEGKILLFMASKRPKVQTKWKDEEKTEMKFKEYFR